MNYQLTPLSANRKTGPIPVSTSHKGTCPPSCPFFNNGCYADGGFGAVNWHKVTGGKRGTDWQTFCQQVRKLPAGQLWRHNQAGDLPGDGDQVNWTMMADLIKANGRSRGFTYTHKPMDADNAPIVALANRKGFTVNLSANSPAHADELASLGIAPVVTVVPFDQKTNSKTPAGRTIVICPAVTHDDVTCASCKLCAIADRECVVGFPAHGSQFRKVTRVATD